MLTPRDSIDTPPPQFKMLENTLTSVSGHPVAYVAR